MLGGDFEYDSCLAATAGAQKVSTLRGIGQMSTLFCSECRLWCHEWFIVSQNWKSGLFLPLRSLLAASPYLPNHVCWCRLRLWDCKAFMEFYSHSFLLASEVMGRGACSSKTKCSTTTWSIIVAFTIIVVWLLVAVVFGIQSSNTQAPLLRKDLYATGKILHRPYSK